MSALGFGLWALGFVTALGQSRSRPRAKSQKPRAVCVSEQHDQASGIRAGPPPLHRLQRVRRRVPPRARVAGVRPVAPRRHAEQPAPPGRAHLVPVARLSPLREPPVREGVSDGRVRTTARRPRPAPPAPVSWLPLLRDGVPVRCTALRRECPRHDEVRLLPVARGQRRPTRLRRRLPHPSAADHRKRRRSRGNGAGVCGHDALPAGHPFQTPARDPGTAVEVVRGPGEE